MSLFQFQGGQASRLQAGPPQAQAGDHGQGEDRGRVGGVEFDRVDRGVESDVFY
jgi:hypothetical protein